MQHILSLSYGKDSFACLGAIEELGWPLDRIVHAEIWATDTIPADLPPMVEFKANADKIIKERWGIEVEHIKSIQTYDEVFYRVKNNSKVGNNGKIYGFPVNFRPWCTGELKQKSMRMIRGKGDIHYLGIAVDEPKKIEKTRSLELKCHLLRWVGMKRIAANGARKTTSYLRYTQQPHGEDAGFAIISL